MIYVDLVLDNNQLVRIEVSEKYEDDFHDAINNAMKQQCTWSPGMFEGCRATLNGLMMGRIYMNRVVGML